MRLANPLPERSQKQKENEKVVSDYFGNFLSSGDRGGFFHSTTSEYLADFNGPGIYDSSGIISVFLSRNFDELWIRRMVALWQGSNEFLFSSSRHR